MLSCGTTRTSLPVYVCLASSLCPSLPLICSRDRIPWPARLGTRWQPGQFRARSIRRPISGWTIDQGRCIGGKASQLAGERMQVSEEYLQCLLQQEQNRTLRLIVLGHLPCPLEIVTVRQIALLKGVHFRSHTFRLGLKRYAGLVCHRAAAPMPSHIEDHVQCSCAHVSHPTAVMAVPDLTTRPRHRRFLSSSHPLILSIPLGKIRQRRVR